MAMNKKIKVLLIERNLTIKELSAKLGYKSSTFYNKLNRDDLNEQELIRIADALNCDFEGVFTMRDTGKTI